jgi:hypothetical protein
MKTKTIEAVTQLIRDGRVECVTDLKLGHVEIRWSRTGKRETINVTRKYAYYCPGIDIDRA